MIKHRNEKQIRKFYQKHLAKMVHSFMFKALGQEKEGVLKLYTSFSQSWIETVNKINKRYGRFVLNHDAWEDIWKVQGYRNIITKPIPAVEKAAILRIVYIVEGKTEKQRERRETLYKILFLWMRAKLFFKNLFKKKA